MKITKIENLEQLEKLNKDGKLQGFFDIENELYHSSFGLSSTDLKCKTPAHYRHKEMVGSKQTEALKFGSAYHCAVLEPDRYEKDYVVLPENINLKTNAGKGKKAELERIGIILKSEQMKKINAMKIKLYENMDAKYLIENGYPEVSCYYTFPDIDIVSKIRIDSLSIIDGKPIIIDLKTTGDASIDEFMKSFGNYKYYLSAAYYIDVLKEFFVDEPEYIFIAQEKDAPYEFQIFKPDSHSIQAGRIEYISQMTKLRDCINSKQFPGYSTDIMPLSLPLWHSSYKKEY